MQVLEHEGHACFLFSERLPKSFLAQLQLQGRHVEVVQVFGLLFEQLQLVRHLGLVVQVRGQAVLEGHQVGASVGVQKVQQKMASWVWELFYANQLRPGKKHLAVLLFDQHLGLHQHRFGFLRSGFG